MKIRPSAPVALHALAVRLLVGACIFAPGCNTATSPSAQPAAEGGRRWLAGEHHIHSRYSVGLDRTTVPPTPVVGGAGGEPYPIPMNAVMAKYYGLAWMVSTDHGGPNHAKVNFDKAYPELVQSRLVVPEVVQFYGMELNPPAADHASVIVPHSGHERQMLHDIEFGYDKSETYPRDPSRDTEAKMIEALQFMERLSPQPVVIANHPSRSATALGVYGQNRPDELRNWNDAAPNVSVGMEGAPGHQAGAIKPDGSNKPAGVRGGYRQHPTMGGYDQMTARLGGFWDSMLGEGRRWWITANSDSHVNWREGGNDFWPGEYTKTYVFAEKNHADILDGIRRGRIFVTTGDLVAELDVTVSAPGGQASIGETLRIAGRTDVTVTIWLRDPAGRNPGGLNPEVARVDLIVGDITGRLADRATDTNPTTRVVKRFAPAEWRREGEYIAMTHRLEGVQQLRAGARHQHRRARAGARSEGREPVGGSLVLFQSGVYRAEVSRQRRGMRLSAMRRGGRPFRATRKSRSQLRAGVFVQLGRRFFWRQSLCFQRPSVKSGMETGLPPFSNDWREHS